MSIYFYLLNIIVTHTFKFWILLFLTFSLFNMNEKSWSRNIKSDWMEFHTKSLGITRTCTQPPIFKPQVWEKSYVFYTPSLCWEKFESLACLFHLTAPNRQSISNIWNRIHHINSIWQFSILSILWSRICRRHEKSWKPVNLVRKQVQPKIVNLDQSFN